MTKPALAAALSNLKIEKKYRNDLERKVAKQLKEAGIAFAYEADFIPYTVPAREHKYLPDFRVPGGIIIESKGHFGYLGRSDSSAEERKKYALIKEQHPDLDIRFVFSRASAPIYKGSKTTHGKWATDHNFKWADNGRIPPEWIKELQQHKRKQS